MAYKGTHFAGFSFRSSSCQTMCCKKILVRILALKSPPISLFLKERTCFRNLPPASKRQALPLAVSGWLLLAEGALLLVE